MSRRLLACLCILNLLFLACDGDDPGDDDDTTQGDDDDATPEDDDDATPGDDDDVTPGDDDDVTPGDDDDVTPGDDDDDDATPGDDDDSGAGDDDDSSEAGDDDDSANPAAVTVPGDFSDIQMAIDMSAAGVVIEVAAGTYAENLDFGGKAVHVRGAGAGATVLDGMQTGPVVRFANGEGADSVLQGFTLTGGSGQMIQDEDGAHNPCGGGVFVRGASPTLLDVTIRENQAWDGAGLYLADGAAPLLSNVTIVDNVASDDGGGLYAWQSAPVLNHVRLAGNEAQGQDGGGMVVKENSAAVLTHVVFAGNSAPDDGGGLRVKDSDAELHHVVFVGNRAGDGAALAVKSSLATLDGVVMAYNAASSQGGAIYEKNGGSAVLSYCNAWSNTPSNYDGSGGMVDPTGIDGNVSMQPHFLDTSAADVADWDLHLAATSPLIDTGDPAVLDPDGSRADMGAYGGPTAASWDLDGDGYPLWWLPGPFDPATSPGMDCEDRDDAVYPGSGC